VCLAESSFQNNLGFEVSAGQNYRSDAYWFGEAQGRVVVSVSPEKQDEFEKSLNIPFEKLGMVTGAEINVSGENWGKVSFWKEKYFNVLTQFMEEA